MSGRFLDQGEASVGVGTSVGLAGLTVGLAMAGVLLLGAAVESVAVGVCVVVAVSTDVPASDAGVPSASVPLISEGISSVWPAWIAFASVRPLAAIKSSTVVPKSSARPPSVSPCWTTYRPAGVGVGTSWRAYAVAVASTSCVGATVISSTTGAVGRGEDGAGGAQAARTSSASRAATQCAWSNNGAFCFILSGDAFIKKRSGGKDGACRHRLPPAVEQCL